MDYLQLRNSIFEINDPLQFNELAVAIFHYQHENNRIYRQFVDLLNVNPTEVKSLVQIPFLPISAFRSHKVISGNYTEEAVFESSGTTSSNTSRHFVVDFSLYEKSFLEGFKLFFGDIEEYTVFGLLPSYLERGNSSLVYMVNKMIQKAHSRFGGFYLDEFERLENEIRQAAESGKKVMLIGVTFALIDFTEFISKPVPELIVVETGGMKGRRKEIVREELHSLLCKRFGVESIYSEYGMTELLSQAWSKGKGEYLCPPWMKILLRDTTDALSNAPSGKTGGINVIDLANLNSCSFIATQDLGRINENGSFEVLGRFDNSQIRGCSLMVE